MTSFNSRAAKYDSYGNPTKVIKIATEKVELQSDDSVIVKVLAAPINPSDWFQIMGVYPMKPPVPNAYGGIEGLLEVVQVGKNVKGWQVGDKAIPSDACLGTWRTHFSVSPSKIIKVPSNIPVIAGATMAINVFTAYQMLKIFVKKTEKGENYAVIQNASNSGVGRAVIQLAKLWGIPTVNVIRSRTGVESLVKELKDLGATHVLTEDDMDKPETAELLRKEYGDRLKVGFNCVGGKSATNLASVLSPGGSLVVYGAMTNEPNSFSGTLFLFNDITVCGFWIARWTGDKKNAAAFEHMVKEVSQLFIDGKLKEPLVQINHFAANVSDQDVQAKIFGILEDSMKGFINKKQILQFE